MVRQKISELSGEKIAGILTDYNSGLNNRGKRYSLTDLEIKYQISKSSINKILHSLQEQDYTINWRGSPIHQKPSQLEIVAHSEQPIAQIEPNYTTPTPKPSKNSSYPIKPIKRNILKVAAAIALSLTSLISNQTSDTQVSNNYQPQTISYNQEESAQSPTIQPQLTQVKVAPELKVEYATSKVKTNKINPKAVFASLNFGVQRIASTLENKLLELKDYSRKHYEEIAKRLPNGLEGKYDEAHRAIVLTGGLAVNPDADLSNMYELSKPEIAKTHLSENEILINYDMKDKATMLFFFRDTAIENFNLTISELAEIDNKISSQDFQPKKLSYTDAVRNMEDNHLNL